MAHASSPFPVPVCTRLLLSVRTFGEGNSCRNKKSLQPLQVQQPLKLLVMPTLTWALNPVMPAVSGITWCKKINGWFFFSLWFAVYHRKKMTQGPAGSYTWDWSNSSIGHTLSPDASFQGSLGRLDIHKSWNKTQGVSESRAAELELKML